MARGKGLLVAGWTFLIAGTIALVCSLLSFLGPPGKLVPDTFDLVGTALLFTGGALIVLFVTRHGLVLPLFLLGGVVFVAGGLINVTEEISALSAVPILGANGWGNNLAEDAAVVAGPSFIFLGMLALLYETAKLRRAAEEERRRYLEAHEDTLFSARVADMSAQAVVGVDQQGKIRFWNLGAHRLFGYKSQEAIGMTVKDLISTEGNGNAGNLHNLLNQESPVYDFELMGRSKEGKKFMAAATISPVMGDAGSRIGVSVTIRDIGARKQRERELIRSRNLLANTLQALEVGVFILDRDTQPIEYNPAMSALTGFTWEDLRQGATTTETVIAKLLDPSSTLFQELQEQVYGNKRNLERRNLTIRHRDGGKRVCNLAVSPVLDESGEVIAAAGVAIDMTDRERLQAQLLAAQKMESLGRMAGGIAHDFNNILSGVLGYASVLEQKLAHDEGLVRMVCAIEDSAKRAAEVTRQLLTFASGGPRRFESVSLNQLLRETITLFSHSVNPNVRLRFEPCPGPLVVEVDPRQIQQVFMNLLVNARDAVGDSGTIEVATEAVTDGVAYRPLEQSAGSAAYAHVIVTDTGHGMSPDVVQRVFDPFFSLKGHGGSYGLGLSVAYGIVKAHAGEIRVHSTPGQGTRFEVILPVNQMALQPVVPSAPRAMELGPGHGTILVVDDEQLIRSMTRDLLQMAGYEVMVACDGAEALAILRERGHEIDLVILDLLMPGMDGAEVFKSLREVKPSLPCIFSSGYGAEDVAAAYRNDEHVRILSKPYEAATLTSAIRELLEQ